jgi:hypothetical protein
MLISALVLAVSTMASPIPAERDQLRLAEHMYWRSVNAQQIDVWLGKEEVWRFTVSPTCPAWPASGPLTLATRQGHFKRHHTLLPNRSDACRLLHIEPTPANVDRTVPNQKIMTVEVGSAKGNNKP